MCNLLHHLDERHGRPVTFTHAELQHPGIATGPRLIPRSVFREDLINHFFIENEGEGTPRDARPPSLPSVIILSARPLASLALTSVVLILP